MDAKVNKLVDTAAGDDDVDEDALIAALEDDSELERFRENRRQQLHSEFVHAKQMKDKHHGTYTEIKDEKELMDATTSTRACVVHFSKSDFARCRIMGDHLERLAAQHWEARFLSIDVVNAPFLVEKLKVQVLPCVIAFIDGKSVDRLVGFEGIGAGNDSFTTKDLELRLLRSSVLTREKLGNVRGIEFRSKQNQKQRTRDADSSDFDDSD